MKVMNVALLRELHEARPFVPFEITMADGRKIPVIDNEFLAFFPTGRAAMVTHADDRFTLVDLLMITAVDVDPKFRLRRGKSAAKR